MTSVAVILLAVISLDWNFVQSTKYGRRPEYILLESFHDADQTLVVRSGSERCNKLNGKLLLSQPFCGQSFYFFPLRTVPGGTTYLAD